GGKVGAARAGGRERDERKRLEAALRSERGEALAPRRGHDATLAPEVVIGDAGARPVHHDGGALSGDGIEHVDEEFLEVESTHGAALSPEARARPVYNAEHCGG